ISKDAIKRFNIKFAYSIDNGVSYDFEKLAEDGTTTIVVPKGSSIKVALVEDHTLIENVNDTLLNGNILVDKSKLENLLNEKNVTDGMTPESAKKYQDAIAAGQEVFKDPNATQDQVDEAVKAIEAAKAGLTVDKTQLQGVIDTAKDKLQNGNLNQESQNSLQDAINKAEGILGKPNATVDEVQNALNDLQNAIDNVVEKADKSELDKLLKENISLDGMTPESIKKYQDAIAAGQKVFDDQNATQDQVNKAIEDINNAKTGLTVDTSALKDAIDKANDKLQNGNLNQQSHDKLQDAINKAEEVLNKQDATVTEVQNALNDLQNAMGNAVEKVDKSELDKLLKENISLNGMTPESIKKYQDAIAAGQKVFDDQNATQDQVNKAIEDIKAAKTALTTATIESNFKAAYWDGNHLTLDGIFDILDTNEDQNSKKVLKIKNEQGDVVKEIPVANASWDGKTGYQCFISTEDFEELNNGKYTLFVSTIINGNIYERNVKQSNSLLKYLIHDNINQLETFRISNATIDFSSDAENNIVFDKVEESALVTNVNAKTMYFLNNDLVIDGNFGFEGIELNAPLNTKLVLKDSTGQTIETIATYNANWGKKNTGFQCIIKEDILTKLATGEYTLYATAEYQGKAYEAKLTSKSNLNINKVIASSNISANGNVDSVTITKNEKVKYQSSANIKQSYWDGDDFVINGNINIGDKELDKSITKKLIIKNSQGVEVNSINTASVDWFTKTGDYSGFQAIIPKAIIEKLEVGEYSFEVKTTYDDMEYRDQLKQESSLLRIFNVHKDINNTESKSINNLLYKFATDSNNNVKLNVKVDEDVFKAQSKSGIYLNVDAYYLDGTFTANGKVVENNGKNYSLLLKDSNNNIVVTNDKVYKGWGEYTYQGAITQNMVENLLEGTYTIYMRARNTDDKLYEAQIALRDNYEIAE
ncbi:MAG: hypothetical protein E6343_16150, partial [Clostridium perfringens]|nr:hypothetical protein [Clostridium perfringens]